MSLTCTASHPAIQCSISIVSLYKTADRFRVASLASRGKKVK